MNKNYFAELNAVDCSDKIEKKNGLSYLSWAFAWGELKKRFPLSKYTVYENEFGRPWFDDGRTGWVKTGVTVVFEDGTSIEHIEYLPIMDVRNRSIPAETITSFDANKSVQRSLTKAVARHGCGLFIYAGEDLPEEVKEAKKKEEEEIKKRKVKETEVSSLRATCERVGVAEEKILKAYKVEKLEDLTFEDYTKAMKRLSATQAQKG